MSELPTEKKRRKKHDKHDKRDKRDKLSKSKKHDKKSHKRKHKTHSETPTKPKGYNLVEATVTEGIALTGLSGYSLVSSDWNTSLPDYGTTSSYTCLSPSTLDVPSGYATISGASLDSYTTITNDSDSNYGTFSAGGYQAPGSEISAIQSYSTAVTTQALGVSNYGSMPATGYDTNAVEVDEYSSYSLSLSDPELSDEFDDNLFLPSEKYSQLM